ncbi:SOS response-associated peptidase [Pontixanthobacter gangjinensis]|uniref:Abasic site processing protein n=1 Tax=Pontixanthobacter gangjinensis TaxID=1028742 RepID=A0A6I4SKI4_9SPHN|nr:SOS response-associated peptidase family protein [Pontixanthobacter gangjinensis]MXO56223.1 DUF159 family protein [Pontixanthobacter gangjinensis]
MTHLYRLDSDAAAIANAFGMSKGDDPWAGGYIAPGNFAPVITAGREFIAGPRNAHTRPRMIPRIWGVPPPPNVPYDGHNAVLTVRNPDSPFWVGNLRNSEFRCLLPATAFMEWGSKTDAEGRRVQHWFAPSDQSIFAFAGVWKDSEVPGFALLTCEANALLKREGYERMPVILPPDPAVHQTWLYADWARARTLLQPYSSSLMRGVERSAV